MIFVTGYGIIKIYELDGIKWVIPVRLFTGEEYKWYGSNSYPLSWKRFIKAINTLDLPQIG